MILRGCVVPALLMSALAATVASAQGFSQTRLTIGGNFLLSEPRSDFRQNVGSPKGGGVTATYNLLRSGLLGMRFDLAGMAYGKEKRSVPLSPSISSRVALDLTTSNSVTALTWGPELARPSGRIRPYINAGYGRLLFRTTSSLGGVDTSEDGSGGGITTTNHKDSTGAWVYGGGVRFGLGPNSSPVSLDLGARYHRGGTVSYLREGSIQDNSDGSITINPLSSRTPIMMYTIGVKIRLPFDPKDHCGRFLC